MKKIIETRTRVKTKMTTDELAGVERLLSIYPTGILSMVSDTFDIWRMLTEYLPKLKHKIMARDGKLVIRPDSGNPSDIICGLNTCEIKDYLAPNPEHPSYKGVIELLWDVFGGTINAEGYKVLDPHIGAIYGDSITIERADEIARRLASKGFASTNIVLGVGSFTYQFNTRDTFGFAMKATYVELQEYVTESDRSGVQPGLHTIGREIFKDPITDDGTKKSATGLLSVGKNSDGEYILFDRCSKEDEEKGELRLIYEDGVFYNTTTLTEIRERLKKTIK